MNELLAKFLFVAAALGTVYAIGKAADDTTRADIKAALSAWLRSANLAKDHTPHIHGTLLATFNSVFSENPFAVRLLQRSLLLSFCGSYIVLALAYLALTIQDGRSAVAAVEMLGRPTNFLLSGFALFVGSAVMDYVSLAKTTLIINAPGFLRSPARYYALDLIVSLTLSLGWGSLLVLLSAITGWISGKDLVAIGTSPEAFALLSTVTALVPTLFALSLCLAVGFGKTILTAGRPLQELKSRVLDIEARPFSAVAILSWPLFAALAVAFVFAIN